MATIQHHSEVRVNAREIMVPWRVFVKVNPDEVWEIVCRRARRVAMEKDLPPTMIKDLSHGI